MRPGTGAAHSYEASQASRAHLDGSSLHETRPVEGAICAVVYEPDGSTRIVGAEKTFSVTGYFRRRSWRWKTGVEVVA